MLYKATKILLQKRQKTYFQNLIHQNFFDIALQILAYSKQKSQKNKKQSVTKGHFPLKNQSLIFPTFERNRAFVKHHYEYLFRTYYYISCNLFL